MRFGHGWWSPRPLCQAVYGVASEPAWLSVLGARARTDCVSNIEQLSQVCSAIFPGGGDEQIEGVLMFNHQPTVNGKRPINMPEPRPFGVEDHPSCPSCGAEMHLFRRSPAPGHHAYEVQIFSCMKCDAEMTRSADRKGRPHSSAGSIELETLSRNVARGEGTSL